MAIELRLSRILFVLLAWLAACAGSTAPTRSPAVEPYHPYSFTLGGKPYTPEIISLSGEPHRPRPGDVINVEGLLLTLGAEREIARS